MIFIFILIYLFFGFFSILGVLKYNKSKLNDEGLPNISLSDIHLIIPFRNEENRIQELIQSLNNSVYLPYKVTFIDDHSTDDTIKTLKSNLKINNYQILRLPDTKKGKKAAIRYGIDSNNDLSYILTLDADINFNKYYFKQLETLKSIDLLILPVIMKSSKKRILNLFYALDYNFLNLINRISTGWIRPILASGANLLFKKKTFTELDSFEHHKNIASGDDMFILKDFTLNNKKIGLIRNTILNVYTSSPENYLEFISQRIRWSNKTKDINDKVSNQILIINVCMLIVFYMTLFTSIYFYEWKQLIFVFLFKNTIDLIIVFIDNDKSLIKNSLLIPIYSIFQPIYYSSVMIGSITLDLNWKNRTIKHKKSCLKQSSFKK